jgi:DNA adenine methylase
MRSFIKYPGGKNKVFPEIKAILPNDFNNYHEPFLGSGSVFLNMSSEALLIGKTSFLNDINKDLMNVWEHVKYFPTPLFNDIDQFKDRFKDESFYYALRDIDRLPQYKEPSNYLRKASRFIILNKLGFNGLVRENEKGQSNVPWGKKDKNFGFFKLEQYLEIREMLLHTSLGSWGYIESLYLAEKDDLIYLDPPYQPSQKGGFTAYTGSWSEEDHQNLFVQLDQLTQNDVKWILSGHETEDYQKLYKNYNSKIISVKRSIGADKITRKNINEMLIWNY